ncbi:hypothetical protein EAH83_06240 [Variovorax ginsengisoli]|uniref:Uncharacterized protein n=1 Tax=Variovorax guangxiensis TaxID=1775474 RepID=A0A502DSN9_9BURK|nr:hypothetical protein EAH83_06240 [Variovorax ginsengisoli]TPG28347.1 hypothetical protein EAH82_05900 [Variovorax guangxiensis]
MKHQELPEEKRSAAAIDSRIARPRGAGTCQPCREPSHALVPQISCHSFRATGIVEYLGNGGKLEVDEQKPESLSALRPSSRSMGKGRGANGRLPFKLHGSNHEQSHTKVTSSPRRLAECEKLTYAQPIKQTETEYAC